MTRYYLGLALMLGLCACGDDSSDVQGEDGGSNPSDGEFGCGAGAGTFDGIQEVVFKGYGCTTAACHGNGAESAGGLDLSPNKAYESLMRVEAQASLSEPMQLVFPGEQAFSFLYHKLAAGTEGTELPAGGGEPMPFGVDPLHPDHLDAVRLWIRSGAPKEGIVAGTKGLLDCGLAGDVVANKIERPEAPALGEGFQVLSGPWTVEAGTEDEVCFATYYDLEMVEGLLPDFARAPCINKIDNYDGECFAFNSSLLVQDPQSHHSLIYAYAGGTGPLDSSWGEWTCKKGEHAGMGCDPTRIGESVMDGGADCGAESVCSTGERSGVGCDGWGPQDQDTVRVSIGGAQSPVAKNDLLPGVFGTIPTRAIIIWNSHAFNLTADDATVEQFLSYEFAPADERDYPTRGIFQTKDIFVQDVPPFESRTYCATDILPRGANVTQINSHVHKRGVVWNTWLPPNDPNCQTATNCEPEPESRKPEYVSNSYNDPNYMYFDPPLQIGYGPLSERTFKYCVTYDNGKDYPELIKRNSTSVGSKCIGQAYCVGGDNEGDYCGDDDGMCGGGGSCDACPVEGGFTTEDEMLIWQGSYFVVPEE